jgi:DNA-binding MarR family transcriptional regulator
MSKKEKFINEIKVLIEQALSCQEMPFEGLSSDALDFWNGLQVSGDNGKPKFTENGKLVLAYMRENKDQYNNLFKAKELGEGLSISSRTASGAMRKLVTDGYAEKIGESPVVYALTELGVNTDPNAE